MVCWVPQLKEKFKCLLEQYVSLQQLRDDLIKLKVEHRSAEEKLQYYLQAGNMELTKIVSDRLNMLFKEIKEPKKKLRNSKAYFCRIIPFLIFI